MCPACYQDGGSLLHCLSTLTSASEAVYFCCTGLGVTSTGRYPASCPAKPGLSSSEPFRLFSRDYLAWLRKCYSSTFFCTCKEISFITVHSVLSNVAKIHFKLPAAMEFWPACLRILHTLSIAISISNYTLQGWICKGQKCLRQQLKLWQALKIFLLL